MKLYLNLAWRNIWRNKQRSIITISSMICAVFFSIFARSLQIGVYDKMVENMVGMYSGYIQIQNKDYWNERTIDNSFAVDMNLQKKLSNSYNVSSFNERFESFALSAANNLTRGTIVIGANLEKENLFMNLNSKIVKGSIPENSSSNILISDGLSEYYNLRCNDSIVLLGQGFHGSSASGIFKIEGIIKFPVPDINERLIIMPIKSAQTLYDAENRNTSLVIDIKNKSKVEKTIEILKSNLDEDLVVMNWKNLLPELVQTIQADSAGGLVILGILYMILSFGIFGTILMMTTERIKEFSILISIGMHKIKLVVVVILECLLMSFFSSIIGLILVTPVRYYFYYFPYRIGGKAASAIEEYGFEPIIPASLDLNIALNHVLIITIIVLVCSFYPSTKIFFLKPIKGLKI